ncbi:MAG TPA: ankyrin repeat domain-containing protein, partial [Nocardioidaceae bacterium]|nr:ankyrin repeat domain-containing protein [Nocardioidaceae bacterium]
MKVGLVAASFVLAACSTGEGAEPSSTRPTQREGVTTMDPRTSQAQLDQQLRDAAWANDVPRARDLIRQGADVNAKDDTEQSAYLIATSEGYLELLLLTLRNGGDVDAHDSYDGTGLIRAAERGHWRVVGALVQA